MASEDPSHALSPGIGHQTEENGTIIQDHTAPIVVSDLMGKNGATENESNSIDDHTVDQGTGSAREEAKDYNENEVDISFVKTESFKNEVQSRRIAMEDEVQRRIMDSLLTWFLREEEMVDNENKEEEEEEEEEDDKYSVHREFLLSLENWDEAKADNEEILEERFVGCNGKTEEAAESGVSMVGIDPKINEDCNENEKEELQVEKVEDQSGRIAIDDDYSVDNCN